jgi:pantoate--beta-alanine ligase
MAEPRLLRDVESARRALANARTRGERIAVVPTMGALHDGHLGLVTAAKKRADTVVVTIFVNPTQFGPNEDFTKYPRDLEGDRAKLATVGADLIFAPEDASTLYAPGDETRIRVPETAKHLEGTFRPHHFEGVATIVLKLFQVVPADVAVFGRKDYQQLKVVERMVKDLFVPIEIVGHPTVREADGLARSSRNAYLSKDERARAVCLSRGLAAAVRAFEAGERRAGALAKAARDEVEKGATSIDYVACADADKVAPFEDTTTVPERALIAIAARVGTTRLIDNVVLGEERGPVDVTPRT